MTVYMIQAPPIKGRIENKISQHIFDNLDNNEKRIIKGIPNEVEPKSFGFYDTDTWIEHQLCVIKNIQAEKLEDGDVLFFSDFWFPGLDLIKLYVESLQKQVYFSSFLHGASFIEGDLMGSVWCGHSENAWMNIYDSVLIQTEHSRKNIQYANHYNKCAVVGSPFNASDFTSHPEKSYDIIWPHRLSEDKGLSEFIAILPQLQEYRVAITVPVEKIDPKLLDTLEHNHVEVLYSSMGAIHRQNISRTKVVLSTAKQETWGYAVMEAVASGAVPIVPNRACYPYLYDADFRYNTPEECIEKIKNAIDDTIKPPIINSCIIKGSFNKGQFLCAR